MNKVTSLYTLGIISLINIIYLDDWDDNVLAVITFPIFIIYSLYALSNEETFIKDLKEKIIGKIEEKKANSKNIETTDIKGDKHIYVLTLVTAFVAFIAYYLPWISVSVGSHGTFEMSGGGLFWAWKILEQYDLNLVYFMPNALIPLVFIALLIANFGSHISSKVLKYKKKITNYSLIFGSIFTVYGFFAIVLFFEAGKYGQGFELEYVGYGYYIAFASMLTSAFFGIFKKK